MSKYYPSDGLSLFHTGDVLNAFLNQHGDCRKPGMDLGGDPGFTLETDAAPRLSPIASDRLPPKG